MYVAPQQRACQIIRMRCNTRPGREEGKLSYIHFVLYTIVATYLMYTLGGGGGGGEGGGICKEMVVYYHSYNLCRWPS